MFANKKLNCEIIVDDNLRGLGFQQVCVFDKNILIKFADDRPQILSKFKVDDLESTMLCQGCVTKFKDRAEHQQQLVREAN